MQLNVYNCDNCGAELIYSPSIKNLKCNFCSSTFEIEDSKSKQLKYEKKLLPDKIIPFSINEDQFKDDALEWLIEGDYTPLDVIESADFTGFSGTYFPLVKYKGSYEGSWSASSGYKRREQYLAKNSSGKLVKKTRTVTDWSPSNGDVKSAFTITQFAGESSSLNDDIVHIATEDGYLNAVDFNDKYLANFTLSRQVFDSELAWRDSSLTSLIESKAKKSIPGDTYRDFTCSYNHNIDMSENILSPTWFAFYDYKGEKFHLACGGASGKVVGIRPKDAAAEQKVNSFYGPTKALGWSFLGALVWLALDALVFFGDMVVPGMVSIGLLVGWIIAWMMANSQKAAFIKENKEKRAKILKAKKTSKKRSISKKLDDGQVHEEE